MNTTTVDALERRARTGDLLLFRGNGITSELVRFWSRTLDTRWTHVAVLVRLPCGLCVLESCHEPDLPTILKREDDDGSAAVRPPLPPGVRLLPLRYRVQSYDGEISYRRLNGAHNAPDERVHYFLKCVRSRRYENWGDPAALREMMDSTRADRVPDDFDLELEQSDGTAVWQMESNPHSKRLFCTELVALFYMVMGWIECDPRRPHYVAARMLNLRDYACETTCNVRDYPCNLSDTICFIPSDMSLGPIEELRDSPKALPAAPFRDARH